MSDQWGVGSKAQEPAFDKTKVGKREVELIFGEHPHSRRDNNIYGRDEHGNITGFDGHRRLIDIKVDSSNYMKSSGLSGDEIRKSVMGYVYSDGLKVYEVFGREVDAMLIRLHHILQKLEGHESHWLNAKSRQELVGRKIYYHDQSAVIESLIEEQGCIIVRTNVDFKIPPQSVDDEYGTSWYDDYRNDDGSYSIKTEVLSESIWWWREA